MEELSIILSTGGWTNSNGCYVKGFVFYENIILQGIDFANTFLFCKTENDFRQKIKSFNGQFSVVLVRSGFVWLGVDKLRQFPLFYSRKDEGWVVSDNTSSICNTEKKLNRKALIPFLLSGYCLGYNTLLKNVFQVEAGQFVELNNESASKINYYNYFGKRRTGLNFADAKHQLAAILNAVIADYIKLHNGKTIIVTLSGGFDSRLLLTLLKKHNYQNVLAVTYGRKGLPEVAIAKKVTDKLNCEWINVGYDKIVQKDLLFDKRFTEYYQYAANDVSMFYLQDYFAVQYLKDSGILDKYNNPVFMPGYSGDFLAGAHLNVDLNTSKFDKQVLIKALKKEHFYYLNLQIKDEEMHLNDKVNETTELPWTNFENWETKERQSKFIVNSAKVFNFFGYDYVTPLWDDRLQYFFRDLPFEWKYEQKLYREVLREYFFEPYNLLFAGDMVSIHRQKRVQDAKNRIKKILPRQFVDRFTDNSDWYCYAEVIELMKQQKEHPHFIPPRQSNYHNAYLTQWYLMKEYGWDGKIEKSG